MTAPTKSIQAGSRRPPVAVQTATKKSSAARTRAGWPSESVTARTPIASSGTRSTRVPFTSKGILRERLSV